jgi:hypothetical protein
MLQVGTTGMEEGEDEVSLVAFKVTRNVMFL